MRFKTQTLLVVTALVAAMGGAVAQKAVQDAANAKTQVPPNAPVAAPFTGPLGLFQMPTGPSDALPPNTFSYALSAEAKMNAFQSMNMFNPLSLRQMMNIMVAKKKAKDGVSFDDVVESMRLRANKRNFKFVGHSPLSKDVVAMTGNQNTPRVEIFSFCNAVVAREILDYVPEFVAFLPCRIAVIEDAKKAIWLVTLDWDVRWLDTSNHPDKISPQLRKNAVEIRDAIEDIMSAGAGGEL